MKAYPGLLSYMYMQYSDHTHLCYAHLAVGGIASLYVCSSVSVSSHLCLTLHCYVYIILHCVRLIHTDPLFWVWCETSHTLCICSILTTPTCVTPTWLCGGIASLYVCSSVSVSSHLCLTLHCYVYIILHCVRLIHTDPLFWVWCETSHTLCICSILTTPTCVTPTWLCGGIASLYVCSSVSVSSHLCLTLHCYIVLQCCIQTLCQATRQRNYSASSR